MGEWECGGLGGVVGGETLVRTYCMCQDISCIEELTKKVAMLGSPRATISESHNTSEY